jgi:phosphoglycolate phosphatase-like HAD superfamily hydrolase
MRVLALDFDGVLCDSAREVFTTAVHTFAGLEPRSDLAGSILARSAAASPPPIDMSGDPAFADFARLMPLGNRAEDFGVALLAMDQGVDLPDQESYDAFYLSIESSWRDRFHREFYVTRRRLRAADLDGWLALHADYPPFSAFLRRAAGRRIALAIATAKDADSLDVLLVHLGVADLFPEQLRLDKETGVSKTEHLTVLARRLAVDFEKIAFIDDKVNHLERVAPLGVRPVLAGWGHNTPREHARAMALGFAVAQLDTAENVLLSGS